MQTNEWRCNLVHPSLYTVYGFDTSGLPLETIVNAVSLPEPPFKPTDETFMLNKQSTFSEPLVTLHMRQPVQHLRDWKMESGLTSSFNSQVSEQTFPANTCFDSQGVSKVAIWQTTSWNDCDFTSTWSLHRVTKSGTLYLVLFLPVYVEDYQSSERVSFLKVFHSGALKEEYSKVKVV